MTMLDRMRQHRNWLKWSLAIVAVAMVIFFIPNFMRNPSGSAAAGGAVAVVEGREIRSDELNSLLLAPVTSARRLRNPADATNESPTTRSCRRRV